MVGVIIAAIVLLFITYQIFVFVKKKQARVVKGPFPDAWHITLREEVDFYNRLPFSEQLEFQKRIQTFLSRTKITGVSTDVSDKDKILVAAAGLIPIFYIGESSYPNLEEVLIYPRAFSKDHQIEGVNRNVAGMVGTGYMNGTMILSKKALHHGFKNSRDGQNTAIHEFVHLIDGWDGAIDGLPQVLINNASTAPWLDLIRLKIKEIHNKKSDIDPYGGSSPTEFFAVAAEYFFEAPNRMKKEHPALYDHFVEIFKSA